MDLALPEGLSAEYNKSMFLYYNNLKQRIGTPYEFTITAGENVSSINDVCLKVKYLMNAQPMFIPMTFFG